MNERHLANEVTLRSRRSGFTTGTTLLHCISIAATGFLAASIGVLAAAVKVLIIFATLAKQYDLLVLTGALSVIATLTLRRCRFSLGTGERADKHRVAGAGVRDGRKRGSRIASGSSSVRRCASMQGEGKVWMPFPQESARTFRMESTRGWRSIPPRV